MNGCLAYLVSHFYTLNYSMGLHLTPNCRFLNWLVGIHLGPCQPPALCGHPHHPLIQSGSSTLPPPPQHGQFPLLDCWSNVEYLQSQVPDIKALIRQIKICKFDFERIKEVYKVL